MRFSHSGNAVLSIVQLQHLPMLSATDGGTDAATEDAEVMKMSDATLSDTAHGGALGRTIGAFQSLGRRFADYRRFQQTVNELSVLNDRELRDLGLQRSSLKSVAHQAVYQNG